MPPCRLIENPYSSVSGTGSRKTDPCLYRAASHRFVCCFITSSTILNLNTCSVSDIYFNSISLLARRHGDTPARSSVWLEFSLIIATRGRKRFNPTKPVTTLSFANRKLFVFIKNLFIDLIRSRKKIKIKRKTESKKHPRDFDTRQIVPECVLGVSVTKMDLPATNSPTAAEPAFAANDTFRYFVSNTSSSNTSVNMSVNDTGGSYFDRDEELAKIEIALQSTILYLALFGNIFVLVVLRLRRQKLTRMQWFIVHLSLADIFVAVFNTLPQLIMDVTNQFYGDDFLCRFVKYVSAKFWQVSV